MRYEIQGEPQTEQVHKLSFERTAKDHVKLCVNGVCVAYFFEGKLYLNNPANNPLGEQDDGGYTRVYRLNSDLN